MNISAAKKIRRDICRTMGHEWKELSPSTCSATPAFNTECSRCKKRVWTPWGRIVIPTAPISARPKVKYADINVKKYDILNRMKDRASGGDKA